MVFSFHRKTEAAVVHGGELNVRMYVSIVVHGAFACTCTLCVRVYIVFMWYIHFEYPIITSLNPVRNQQAKNTVLKSNNNVIQAD